MIYVRYWAVGFALIVLQTSLFYLVAPLRGFYDLLVPLVISIGYRRSLREGLVLTLVLGLAADSVAGSPFGLYLTSYVWICLGVYQTKGVLEVSNFLILAAVCVICVLFQNLVLIIATLITHARHPFNLASLGVIGLQLIWVVTTGPPLFFIFSRIAPAADEPGYAQ